LFKRKVVPPIPPQTFADENQEVCCLSGHVNP
jgi:hypothetical protein